MKHIYLVFLLVTSIGFAQLTPPASLQTYYTDVDFSKTGSDLYDDLATTTIAKHTTFLTYSQRHQFLYNADEDSSNESNVLLMYSGESRSKTEYVSGSNPNSTQTFNTEHVYPRSLLDIGISEADLHLLRSCDTNINSSRGNNPFTDGSGTPNQAYFSTGSSFFPGWEWRGDVARIIMYVNLRYNEPFSDVGSLSLFLQWNAEDQVSDFEINRNEVISGAQGNRNPFIDNPYLATVIWGGPTATNRWAPLSNNVFSFNDVQIYPNPNKNNKLFISTTSDLDVVIYSVLGKLVLTNTINSNTITLRSSLRH